MAPWMSKLYDTYTLPLSPRGKKLQPRHEPYHVSIQAPRPTRTSTTPLACTHMLDPLLEAHHGPDLLLFCGTVWRRVNCVMEAAGERLYGAPHMRSGSQRDIYISFPTKEHHVFYGSTFSMSNHIFDCEVFPTKPTSYPWMHLLKVPYASLLGYI